MAPHPGTAEPLASSAGAVRAALTDISARFGPALLRDPARCEAMLRDLCPGSKREIFLIVTALRENIPADLLKPHDELTIAGGIQRLRDHLGLTENSARWAVEAWIPAAEAAAAWREPPRPLALPQDAPAAETDSGSVWIACCLAAVVLSLAFAGVALRVALWHGWTSFTGWAVDALILCGGLGAVDAGLFQVARRLHEAGSPHRDAASLALRILTVLILPAALPAAAAIWTGEWLGYFHVAAAGHDLAFHLGRILQTILLGAFSGLWVVASIRIQGIVASSVTDKR